MDYNRPELGERLAADYVLGLMPPRACRRFERVMAGNATLAATAAAWSDRLSPLDTLTADETPPAHVWRAIDRRVGQGVRQTTRPRAYAYFWNGLLATALAACAAVAIFIAVGPTPLRNSVEALAEKTGLAARITAMPHMPDIGLSTMALGVSERERPRWLRAALLLTSDAVPLTEKPPAQSR